MPTTLPQAIYKTDGVSLSTARHFGIPVIVSNKKDKEKAEKIAKKNGREVEIIIQKSLAKNR